jgi:hypothetical protein
MALGQAILVASEAAPGLLQRVWAEMDYRLDICLVMKGGHIEHLRGMQIKKNLESVSFHLYVACYNPFRHSSVPN